MAKSKIRFLLKKYVQFIKCIQWPGPKLERNFTYRSKTEKHPKQQI